MSKVNKTFLLKKSIVVLWILQGPACVQRRAIQNNQIKATTLAATTGLDVNDVSVLYPESRTKEFMLKHLLNGDSELVGGSKLLPKVILDSLDNAIGEQFNGDKKISVLDVLTGKPLTLQKPKDLTLDTGAAAWKAVAFRFDPCAPVRSQSVANCSVQLRVILQSGSETGNVLELSDSALHLVFSFGTPGDELSITNAQKVIAERLLALKPDPKSPLSTTGHGLGVHPGMLREGLGGPLTLKFNEFLKSTLLDPSIQGKLSAVAAMVLQRSAEPWVFAGFIVKDSTLIQVGLPFSTQKDSTLVTGVQSETEGGKTIFGVQLLQFSGVGSTVQPHVLGNPEIPSTHGLFDAPSNEEFSRIANIDNPKKSALILNNPNDPKHRDCVSCHTGTQRLFEMARGTRGFAPELRAAWINHPERFNGTPGITGFMEASNMADNNWDVRNFGYRNSKPVITFRTLNETIEVTEMTNKILGLPNPSPVVCDNETNFWQCVLHPTQGLDPKKSCLERVCKNAPKQLIASVQPPPDVDNMVRVQKGICKIPAEGAVFRLGNGKGFEQGGNGFEIGITGSQQLSTDGKIVEGSVRVRLPFVINPIFIENPKCIDSKELCQIGPSSDGKEAQFFSVKNKAKGDKLVASSRGIVLIAGLKSGNVLGGIKWVTGTVEGVVKISDCH